MPNTEYRSFVGEIRNLKAENDFILEVDVWALNSLKTRNNWTFINLEEHKNAFTGKPLLIAYELAGAKIGAGHNMTKKRDENGKEYLSFTGATDERIIGAFSDDPDDIRIMKDANGVDWIVGKAFIWKWYAREAADKIEEYTAEGRPMSVSIEALIEKYRKAEDGSEIEQAYKILGVTLLGDGVNPAVDGAHIAALSEIASEFEELKLRAASYIAEPGEDKNIVPETTQEIKPQKISKDKERSRKLKAFSKKQLASLSARFDGYTAIAAGQDDNGIHVCLMSADGSTAVYTMENLEETIAPEKITKNNAQVVFEFGEDTIQVDCCTITDELSATIVKANSAIENLTSEVQRANETIGTMVEAERKRRLQAAKDAALATLSAFNANRDDKISEDILKALNESIENGDFSECEDKDGCWNGEAEVKNKVLAMCAEKQMEIDKANSDKKRSVNAWDAYAQNNHMGSGLAALINEYGK